MDIRDDDDRPSMLGQGDPLDTGGIPATTDVLREVLVRHRHRQSRLLGIVAVVVLLAGAAAGFAIGDGRGSGQTKLTAGQTGGAPAAGARPANASALATSSTGTSSFSVPSTQLLLRDAVDGTRVRLYSEDMSAKVKCAPNTTCPQPDQSCFPTSLLNAEVSDDQVAGTTGAPVWQAPPATGLDAVSGGVVGNGQPQPILVVLAHAGTDIAKVQVATPYGSDVQSVVPGGWITLAVRLPADYKTDPSASQPDQLPAGTLTALSASGATVSTTNLHDVVTKSGPPPACQPSCPAISKKTAAPSAANGTTDCTCQTVTAPAGTAPDAPAPPVGMMCSGSSTAPAPGSASGSGSSSGATTSSGGQTGTVSSGPASSAP